MTVRRRPEHSPLRFFMSTFSAQLHAFGALLMGLGAFLLLPEVYPAGPMAFFCCLAFLVSGFFVFTASAVYHFLSDGFEASPRVTLLLDRLDHSGIYLFIAGTYTPFLFAAISEPWKTPLLISVWAMAVVGMLYTWFKYKLPPRFQSRIFSTSVFLVMGWILVIRIGEIVKSISTEQLGLLLGGAAVYSGGAVIYALKRPKLFEGIFGFHELWHLCVLAGAALHFALIYSFFRA